MKKFLLLLFLLLIPFSVKGIVKPTSDFYVNDYGNILSPETEKYIQDKSVALNKVDGTQIVVVTVKDLEGESLEDYAYKYFNDNGIGDKDKKNGLLILISVKERKSRIEVGDGLEGILPDGKTGRFQDQYMIPYLKDNKYDEGIKNGYDAFHSEIVKLNHLNLDYRMPKEVEDPIDKLVPFIVVAVLGGAIMGGLFRDGKRVMPILVSIGVLSLPIMFKGFLMVTIIYFIFFMVGFFNTFINDNFGWLSSSDDFGGGGGFSGGGGSSSGGGSSRGF